MPGSQTLWARRWTVIRHVSVAAIPAEKNKQLDLFATGGEYGVTEITVYRMKSAWEK